MLPDADTECIESFLAVLSWTADSLLHTAEVRGRSACLLHIRRASAGQDCDIEILIVEFWPWPLGRWRWANTPCALTKQCMRTVRTSLPGGLHAPHIPWLSYPPDALVPVLKYPTARNP